MRTLPEAFEQRVLLSDGSVARRIRAHDLDQARDFLGAPECLEAINLTRPRLLHEAHVAYLEAGADVVRTNTLEASPLSLQRFGLGESAFYINYSAAETACAAVDAVPGACRRRFVLGVVRDQGWDVAPKIVEDAVATQVEGLLAGGVDGIALDLISGTGRTVMFLRGAARAKERLGARTPVFLQRMNGGPEFSERMVELADGVIRARHGQAGRAGWLAEAILEDRVNLVGGGDTPEDTARLDHALRALAEDGLRPDSGWRPAEPADAVEPASSMLYPEFEPVAIG